MDKEKMLFMLLDNWNKPVVYVDRNHVIQYMNSKAKEHYSRWGDVIGKSIFDCHNENSCRIIKDVFMQLENGAEEVLFANNEKHRVYMRSIRDENGILQGYFERYEPPIGK